MESLGLNLFPCEVQTASSHFSCMLSVQAASGYWSREYQTILTQFIYCCYSMPENIWHFGIRKNCARMFSRIDTNPL